ncbi:VWA domain-containing protein [Candidatus Altiarchaeota archaeon]
MDKKIIISPREWGKTGKIIALLLVVYLGYTLLWSGLGKIDDWQYSHYTIWNYAILGGLVFISFLWLFIRSVKRSKRKTLVFTVGAVIPLSLCLIVASVIFWQLGIFNMGSASMMGFSVGGAKDINNFRRNIENNYLPLPSDMTYEGLYYDYYFDTGEKDICLELFCPSYTSAISRDPLSNESEYYLSVGLNSGIKERDFSRKKLNLVVVLDVSGSMSSPFNRYYYDGHDRRNFIEAEEDEDDDKSKMVVANKAVVGLLDHLRDDDRFGMVVFDSSAYLAKPLRIVGDTDMTAIKGHVLDLNPRGGTNMEAGYREGTALFEEYLGADLEEYENRIIFLTDAQPNTGVISESGLLGLTRENAENNIYTTFIGIGVDFNTELIEHITKIRGANYYSVHSASQFKTRMDDEFEYMVTPMVFNLVMTLDAAGYEIEKVYGSPEANEATGEIMKVNTLFPSKKDEKGTKGGLVLLKLRKTSPNPELRISVSYEDRGGQVDGSEVTFQLKDHKQDYYENGGIRKGILLSRYANLMIQWIKDERQSHQYRQELIPSVSIEEGITIPEPALQSRRSRWERSSIPLRVSDEYHDIFIDFKKHFEAEMEQIQDPTLLQEVEILEKIIKQ